MKSDSFASAEPMLIVKIADLLSSEQWESIFRNFFCKNDQIYIGSFDCLDSFCSLLVCKVMVCTALIGYLSGKAPVSSMVFMMIG